MKNNFFNEIKFDNTLNDIKRKLSLGIIEINKIDEETKSGLIKEYQKSIILKSRELNNIKEKILNIRRSE